MTTRLAILAVTAAAILTGCAARPGAAPTVPPTNGGTGLPAIVAGVTAPAPGWVYPRDLAGLLNAPDTACDPGAWPPCDR